MFNAIAAYAGVNFLSNMALWAGQDEVLFHCKMVLVSSLLSIDLFYIEYYHRANNRTALQQK